MKYLMCMAALLCLLTCKSTKKTTDNAPVTNAADTKPTTVSVEDSMYRLSVSFYSRGGGIDRKAKEQFDQYLHQYQQENNLKISFQVVNWGREGEIDYCLRLNELSAERREVFVSETKELLKSFSLARITENVPCRKWK